MAKKKEKKLASKFMRRRLLLSVVVLAALGLGVWQAAVRLAPARGEPGEAPEAQSQDNRDEDAPDTEPDRPEPEEPEPEPKKTDADEGWMLRLVSPSNPLPEGFEVRLVTVADSYKVDERIADAVRLMFIKAKEDGVDLMICSAYRTPEYQQELYENQVNQQKTYGLDEATAAAAAAAVVALPGTSEHHTGLALDIVTPAYQVLDDGYGETPAAKWLAENAWEYGFILRYPKDKQDITKIIFEPWHYRYVGKEHAKAIYEKGYCLEEYLYIEFRSQEAADGTEAEQEQEPEAVETAGSGQA